MSLYVYMYIYIYTCVYMSKVIWKPCEAYRTMQFSMKRYEQIIKPCKNLRSPNRRGTQRAELMSGWGSEAIEPQSTKKRVRCCTDLNRLTWTDRHTDRESRFLFCNVQNSKMRLLFTENSDAPHQTVHTTSWTRMWRKYIRNLAIRRGNNVARDIALHSLS